MLNRVHLIGSGRVGSAVTARLRERGIAVGPDDPQLVLLCVPDGAIAEVARTVAPGPWVAHVSGATPLAALDPHERRFSVHPLQTFIASAGARAARRRLGGDHGESEDALATARGVAETLGLRPFELADEKRTVYHAGAVFASNYLVTLERAAARLAAAAGAPPEALVPLISGTVENGLRADRPDLPGRLGDGGGAQGRDPRRASRARAPVRDARRGDGDARVKVVRTVAELHRGRAGLAGEVGLVPTMGALHAGHLALLERGARRERRGRHVALRQPRAVRRGLRSRWRIPATRPATWRLAEEAGVAVVFAPPVDELYPQGFQTWVDVEDASRGLEGDARPGHFRGVATVCLKLFTLVRPARAYFGQKDAQQSAVVRTLVRDLALPLTIRVVATVRDPDGLALSSRNSLLAAAERERALALPRALAAGAAAHRAGGDPVAAARASLNGLTPDYVSLLDLDGALVLAAAARVGSTRLLDNVLLEGELE